MDVSRPANRWNDKRLGIRNSDTVGQSPEDAFEW